MPNMGSVLQWLIAKTDWNGCFWLMFALGLAVALASFRIKWLKQSWIIFVSMVAILLLPWSAFELLLTDMRSLTIQLTDRDSSLFAAGIIENEIDGFTSTAIVDIGSSALSDTSLKKFKKSSDWRVTLVSAIHNGHIGGNDIFAKVVAPSSSQVGVIYAQGDPVKLWLRGSMIKHRNDGATLTEGDRMIRWKIAKQGLIRPYEPGIPRTLILCFCFILPIIFFLRLATAHKQLSSILNK